MDLGREDSPDRRPELGSVVELGDEFRSGILQPVGSSQLELGSEPVGERPVALSCPVAESMVELGSEHGAGGDCSAGRSCEGPLMKRATSRKPTPSRASASANRGTVELGSEGVAADGPSGDPPRRRQHGKQQRRPPGGLGGQAPKRRCSGLSCGPPARDLIDCFRWASDAMAALSEVDGMALHQRLAGRKWALSTHFSGMGTVDVALGMLRSAFSMVARGVLDASVAASCETSPSLQRALARRSSGCVFKSVFDRLGAAAPGTDAIVAEAAECVQHGTSCRIPRATMDVSGSPCRPWSRSNRALGKHGKDHPDYDRFRAWAALIRKDLPAIVLHENVEGFPQQVLTEEFGHLYDMHRLHVTPADAGFSFIGRPRVYDVLALSGVVRVVTLQATYDYLSSRLSKDTSSWPQWVWQASEEEWEAEIGARGAASGGATPVERPRGGSGVDHLTDTQRGYLEIYTKMWVEKFGSNPEESANCVFDLGDSPSYKGLRIRPTLPTLRRRNSILWSPSRGRWMLPREKAACMGFPVYSDLARVAMVDFDQATVDCLGALGNAMHVANVGTVVLAVMFAAEWL